MLYRGEKLNAALASLQSNEIMEKMDLSSISDRE
jgi:hypothetical protein